MASLVYDAELNIIQTVSTSQTSGVVCPLTNAALQISSSSHSATPIGTAANGVIIQSGGNYFCTVSNPS